MNQNDVSIQLTHHIDGRGEYDAFYIIHAHIYVAGEKAGHISAVIVDRRHIPGGMFLSACDGHSSILEDMASIFFEPRSGRVKVRKLKVDDDRAPIMCIEEMHVDERYKTNGNSDVGAYALNQLLHHPYVDSWNFCIVVYILDYSERIDAETEERLRNDTEISNSERLDRLMPYKRLDANHFLRNGFYQDRTVAYIGNSCVVAVKSNWDAPLKSHDEVAGVQFYEPPPFPPPPVGKDNEIFQLTKTACQEALTTIYDPIAVQQIAETRAAVIDMRESVQQIQAQLQQAGVEVDLEALDSFQNIQQQLQELEDLESRLNNNNPAHRINQYRQQVEHLIEEGGNLAHSNALHTACVFNNSQIATCIIALDRTTLDSRDHNDITPLMIAAETIAKKNNSVRGFPAAEHAVIDILLRAGANKDALNRDGMTAYGIFLKICRSNNATIYSGMGQQIPELDAAPGFDALREKLIPTGGPTTADLQGFSDDVDLINYN